MPRQNLFKVKKQQLGADHVLTYIDTGPIENSNGVLVFLHGLMMSKEVWEAQIAFFQEKYRVIAIDFTGFGESTYVSSSYSYATHARDINDLLENIRVNHIHLIGWSMGGSVAINFANLFATKLISLILVDASPRATTASDFPWSVNESDLAAMMESLKNDQTDMTRRFVAEILADSEDKEVQRKVLRIANSANLEVVLHHLKVAMQSDLRPLLNRILAPTLLISGELDLFSSPQVNDYMRHQIANSEWIEIPKEGHAPFLTQPDTFNGHLERFLLDAG